MEELEYIAPNEIEKRSFEIIKKELLETGVVLPPEHEDIVVRVIHTTADFDYVKTLCFQNDVVAKAKELILSGATIITDTEMALSGINKKRLSSFNCNALTFMSDGSVEKEAKTRGVTRAYVSMERASRIKGKKIFAIGNAPTALLSLHSMMEKNIFTPDIVIAVPVGFVNVVQSKELFLKSDVPCIINRGRKGGSTVCAAIINALLQKCEER